MTRVVASIEARMGASRLPGKVLMDIGGRPALGHMIDRVKRAQMLDAIIIATSDAPGDDDIARFAQTEGVDVFRGSEDNVLERVIGAHRSAGSDIIVELCGDCPLIDPQVIDSAVERFLEGGCDLVTTTAPQSYPEGLDVEVFALASLEEVAARCDDAEVREHVSSDFYRNQERWRLVSLRAPGALHRPELRLLLDWPEDLQFLRAVCARLQPDHGTRFDTETVLELLDRNPELLAMNNARSKVPFA